MKSASIVFNATKIVLWLFTGIMFIVEINGAGSSADGTAATADEISTYIKSMIVCFAFALFGVFVIVRIITAKNKPCIVWGILDLIFVSILGGIFLLCSNKEDYWGN